MCHKSFLCSLCIRLALKTPQLFRPNNLQVYSVQIRDVGRFLAKFNPWTITFGNRLVRLHCSRIHPSVKLSTPKVYTCSLIVAVSWKISVSNYWRWIWSAQIPCLKFAHTCILTTYVYLKLSNQNSILRQWNLQSHKFYKRYVYPFPVIHLLNP